MMRIMIRKRGRGRFVHPVRDDKRDLGDRQEVAENHRSSNEHERHDRRSQATRPRI